MTAAPKLEKRVVPQYNASVGHGYNAKAESSGYVDATDAPRGTTTSFKISGDSMEPRYSNGETVWVKYGGLSQSRRYQHIYL